ncbi:MULTISPECIES: hypothetical protein [unclassified Ruegeria]|uniref:hypothetical protein n=1 Tax=unclassified Ruegeria TaxID=2625375 RepID=UPI001ADAB48A|nr:MULTISPECIES: hypothetical protein [unclassified Ruegeria]MBO9413681.1 hypothetical protein [Ruegeria sp. R8_1]MBO9417712.1 hypothetical protein [Ruegeria sp. R8_2]
MTVVAMGRGEADPWSCGPPDGVADQPGASSISCGARMQLMGPVRAGVEGAGEVEVRNDRRLELQLDMPHFAGPRLAELASVMSPNAPSPEGGQVEKVVQHHSVFRYYPAGTTPLHSIRVPLSAEPRAVHDGCSLSGGDADGGRLWLDTGWQKLEIKPKDSLLVSWTEEPGLVAPKGANGILGYNLIVRVRALPEVRSTNPDASGVVELMLATQILQDGQDVGGATVRPDLATGVPDPWRVRVRLTSFLDALVLDGGGTLLNTAQRDLLRSCLGISADMLDGASEDEKKTDTAARKALLDPIMLRALDNLPRDPAGLLALTHDYHAPTGLFALRPGQHLRLLVGRDQLAPKVAPSTEDARADFVDLTSQMILPLYAAPTRTFAKKGEDALSVIVGRAGVDAVTLDPGIILQSWNAPTPTISSLSERGFDGTYGIGDPAALELLMAGRLSYVLPPQGEPLQKTRGIPRDFIVKSPETGPRQRARDTLIIAARDDDALTTFLARYQFAGIFGSEPITEQGVRRETACYWGSDPEAEEPVLCGLFTQPMRASLLIDATINGQPRRVPLGTTVGALLPPDISRTCVATSLPPRDEKIQIPPRVTTTARLGDAKRPFAVQLPKYETGPDAVYSSNDCRLLALPLFHGAVLSWTN